MSPARVVFDGSILAAGPPTGVARSFLTTLAAYGRLALASGDPEPVLLVPEGTAPEDAAPNMVDDAPAEGRTLELHGRKLIPICRLSTITVL